ncbi:hypothetical protein F4818DRAFT_412575 [Hypoxylon cercidicola]|nr:hypothetical protein F4818DRAFT_412575 [Hypoxylon cercidicola]
MRISILSTLSKGLVFSFFATVPHITASDYTYPRGWVLVHKLAFGNPLARTEIMILNSSTFKGFNSVGDLTPFLY